MLKRALLPFTVFVTGASVLIVEVVGLRVLSPFYGNTIFTVSSVISVILLALSCGYYVGGKLADRRAALATFFGLILVSGLVLLLFYALGTILLPVLSTRLSIASGPLVSALLLFFPGAFLLGTLSPYAVKLQSMQPGPGGVGSAAGNIFFWSTLGSICGSLSAGFVLIPRFGVDRILIANGIILSLVGLLALLIGPDRKRLYVAAIAFVLCAGSAEAAARYAGRKALYVRDGVYQKIVIYDGEFEGRPTRFLQQDQNSVGAGEGAMFLDSHDPADLAYEYTKYYAVYKLFKPDVRNALVIGGGAYSVPKALLQELPAAAVDVVDIEPSLFSLSKQYFAVPDDSRLHNHVEDGRRFLTQSSKRYDLIFSDVYYSFFSVPPHFVTQEFFSLVKARLGPDGVFVANMIGDLSRRNPSLVMSAIRTFQIAFPNNYVFAVSWPERTDPQNIMLVGYNSDRRVDLSAPSVAGSPDPLIRSLSYKQIDVAARFDLSAYPVLTDNFAPVEFLTSQVLRRSFAAPKPVDGEEMLADFSQQTRYGDPYRAPGRERVTAFLAAEMKVLAQDVEMQTWNAASTNGPDYEATNIIAHFFSSAEKRIVLATRAADASSTAVLIEFARALGDANVPPRFGIDMVFLDDDRQRDAPSGASAGSMYFAGHLGDFYGNTKPVAAIVLNSVCREGLRLLKEQSSVRSAPDQVQEFWAAARRASPALFPDAVGPEIQSDQTVFQAAGIPSMLVADSDSQTAGRAECSATTMEAVGRALMQYVLPGDTSPGS